MSELETRLIELGHELDYPATPDMTGAVVAVLGAQQRRRRLSRRRLVVALAVLVAVAAAVLVISPGARSALRDLFGIGGASIVRVETLPAPRSPADYLPGRVVPLATARDMADFRVRLPRGSNRPTSVLIDESVPGVAVSVVWCCEPEVLLTQFQGGESLRFVQKLAGPGSTIEPVAVDGNAGYWIEGDAHIVLFIDRLGTLHDAPSRLAGNVLLWVEDGVTFRLETDLDREAALRIAGSLD